MSHQLRRGALAALAAATLGAGAAVPVALAAGHAPAAAKTTTTTIKGHKVVVHRVMVVDNMFTPKSLTITRGQVVDFVWSDKNFNTHNVTLVTAPKSVDKHGFHSVDGARDLHFERQFTVAGSYEFVCTIHTNMSFHLTVRK